MTHHGKWGALFQKEKVDDVLFFVVDILKATKKRFEAEAMVGSSDASFSTPKTLFDVPK